MRLASKGGRKPPAYHPFAGSGSTGVGALQAGRRFIGIERVAEYVEVARRRLAAACDERVDAGAQLGLLGVEERKG